MVKKKIDPAKRFMEFAYPIFTAIFPMFLNIAVGMKTVNFHWFFIFLIFFGFGDCNPKEKLFNNHRSC